jgi:small subunit ribosomal protein S7
MPRRSRAERRDIAPDAKFGSRTMTMFINKLMIGGKRALAERLVYEAMDRIAEQTRRPAIDVFDQAVRNATPVVEVKPRRVGGATYQVPVDIRAERRMSLAMRWLVNAARARNGRSMVDKLTGELLDAANGQGNTIKRKEDTHRMAEANRAFVHYRW